MRLPFTIASTLILAAGVANGADLDAGKRVFNKCRTCH
jgi:cytochrome c2